MALVDRSRLLVLAAILALIALLGAGAWWFLMRSSPPPPLPLTPEGRAYVKYLQLSNVEMSAKVSFAGGSLVEITGKITNTGDRAVERVELTCVFYDPYGMVVLRERVPIVRRRLNPGETREFRLPFENPPASWNRQMPQLVIAGLQFAS
jgi:hypothetical protein